MALAISAKRHYCVCVLSRSVTPDSAALRTVACQAPLSMGVLQARKLDWLATASLSTEPPGTPKITGVGSLSLLQGIFPTQGSKPGLSHCRRILYQARKSGFGLDIQPMSSVSFLSLESKELSASLSVTAGSPGPQGHVIPLVTAAPHQRNSFINTTQQDLVKFH